MSPARLGVATALVLLGAPVGCTPPRTIIDVALATDVPATRTLTVRATVLGAAMSAGDASTHQFLFGPGQRLALPGDFWLQPAAGADNAAVTLVLAVAVGPGDHGEPAATFDRVATWRFVPGTVEHESVFLTLGCVVGATGCSRTDVPCTVAELCEESGGTCGDDAACHSVQLPMPDAGSDAGSDAADAGSDANDAGFDAQDPGLDAPPDVPAMPDGQQPDVPAPTDAAGGRVCGVTTRACPPDYGCFAFTSPAGSRCARCGQAGERACPTTACASGMSAQDPAGGVICYDAHVALGSVGGLCNAAARCDGTAQCFDATDHGAHVFICLECGDQGEFCCCTGGAVCRCNGGLACATSSGPTVCY